MEGARGWSDVAFNDALAAEVVEDGVTDGDVQGIERLSVSEFVETESPDNEPACRAARPDENVADEVEGDDAE